MFIPFYCSFTFFSIHSLFPPPFSLQLYFYENKQTAQKQPRAVIEMSSKGSHSLGRLSDLQKKGGGGDFQEHSNCPDLAPSEAHVYPKLKPPSPAPAGRTRASTLHRGPYFSYKQITLNPKATRPLSRPDSLARQRDWKGGNFKKRGQLWRCSLFTKTFHRALPILTNASKDTQPSRKKRSYSSVSIALRNPFDIRQKLTSCSKVQ